jgi:HEAT repeat protein
MVWLNNLRLKSKDPQTRRKAIESLDPEASVDAQTFELLKESLGDAEAMVRGAAAMALAATKDERVADLVVPLLRDQNPEVRQNAATALGRLGDPRVTFVLAAALKDPSSNVRTSAAMALRNLSWHPHTGEEQALFDVALGNARGAAMCGEAALNPLVSELAHDTGFARRAAAEALEGVNDPRRVEPLLAAVTDDEPTVRVSAIHALGKVTGNDDVTAALLRALRDPEGCVRVAAGQVLSKRESTDLVPYFLALISDNHFEVRLVAVQFLGRFYSPQIVEALQQRLGDKDCDVRLAATKALGVLGDPVAVESLVLVLVDEERAIRLAAESSLNQLDPSWAQSEAAQRAASRLEASLNDRPAWVRAATMQVVAKLRAAVGGVSSQNAQQAGGEKSGRDTGTFSLTMVPNSK